MTRVSIKTYSEKRAQPSPRVMIKAKVKVRVRVEVRVGFRFGFRVRSLYYCQ